MSVTFTFRLDAIAPSVTIVPGTDNGIVENRKRRPLTLGEYALFADRVYKAGAPGVYLFNLFDHPKESGVWQAVVGQGLTPGFVRTAARTVTSVDCRHD